MKQNNKQDYRKDAIGAVILAAGASQRMGSPKSMLSFGSRTLLDLALDALSLPALDEKALVLGANQAEIQERHWLDEFEVIINKQWEEGMLSSIQSGLKAIMHKVDWVLFLPCDYALIASTTVSHLLLRAIQAEPKPLFVSPTFYGRSGHPLVVNKEVFEKILELSNDQGLHHLVRSYPDRRAYCEVQDPAICFDIDTPEDYQRALKAWEQTKNASQKYTELLLE